MSGTISRTMRIGSKNNIYIDTKNVFMEGDLANNSVVKDSLTTEPASDFTHKPTVKGSLTVQTKSSCEVKRNFKFNP